MTPKSLIAPARLARRPVLATQSDSRLVDLVRAGHDAAFETIVTRYRAPLLRYVERFLPRERAEDAVQQSFVNAYEAMLRGGAELQLRPWLYRIAHNTALNLLRDRSFRHAELSESIDGVERPDEAVERSLGLREALAAVQALPERQRDAIVLRELEGRTYDEIASELGVSDGSVRQLLHRARGALRAGATAITPTGLLTRLPLAAPEEPIAARVAELCGAGVGGAVVAKVCATALVTSAVVGGVAVAPRGGDDRAVGPERAAASERDAGGDRGGAALPAAGGSPLARLDAGEGGPGRSGTGDDRSGPSERSGRDDSGDRSGSGRSGSDDADDHSGSGTSGSGGDDPDVDNSGPGSGDDTEDHSGSGGGGSGSSGSGSGDSDSGSGSDSSGSGSGSSGSGSGSSGGGSGSSGGGSGSSGSGFSGSGSGDDVAPLETVELDSSGSGSGSSGSGSSGSDSSGSGSSGSGGD